MRQEHKLEDNDDDGEIKIRKIIVRYGSAKKRKKIKTLQMKRMSNTKKLQNEQKNTNQKIKNTKFCHFMRVQVL